MITSLNDISTLLATLTGLLLAFNQTVAVLRKLRSKRKRKGNRRRR